MTVHRLDLGTVTLPADHPRGPGSCAVYGYLVRHPAGPVLIDTGVTRGHPWIDEHYAPDVPDLDDALAAAGAAVDQIVLVINTHLHFDHCGGNRRLAGVPTVVQATELEDARRPRYTVPEWVDFPGAEWREVRGPAEPLPGVGVFPTPGHTRGHQSVVVDLDGVRSIVAGQTIYDAAEMGAEESVEPLDDDAAAATKSSARRIARLRPDRVVFAHDAGEWTPPRTGRAAR